MPITPPRLRTAVAATGLTLGLVGGAALAVTSIDGTASAATAGHTAKTHHAKGARRAGHGLLAHSDHATFEVRRDHAWVTITLDRGQVTSVSSTSITLHRPDGTDVTLALGPTTKYRGESTTASGLVTGHRAAVVSENGTALRVVEAKKAAPASPKGTSSAGSSPTTAA